MGGGVKTEDKKQHFDDIYVAENPVPYKERILDALEYISDDFNKAEFDRLILPWAQQQVHNKEDNNNNAVPLNFVDLCACFGNTTMATLYGMGYQAIRENWTSDETCMTIQAKRRFPAKMTAIDISKPAMAYGEKVGLYDDAIVADINVMKGETKTRVMTAMSEADILISTAALVYLDPAAIEEMLDAFCQSSSKTEGYVMVNFLNPFALEKADVTKRLLLSKLDFVGSRATRHRRLSTLEQNNYTGEEWALLEIWVLKRRSSSS